MNRIISWSAVILWMALIFYLSHQPATQSSQLSTAITEVIAENIEKLNTSAEFDRTSLSHIVRKNAHFFIYLVLGFIVSHALRNNRVELALLICVFYAVSDEVHQLFVLGRGAQVLDVFIDSAGAGVGIGLYCVIDRVLKVKRGSGIKQVR